NEYINKLKRQLTTEQDDLAEKIEELKAEYIEFLNEQAAVRNERQSIKQQIQQLSGRNDHQSKKQQDMLDLKKTLEEKQSNLSADLTKQEKAYEDMEQHVQMMKENLKHKRDDVERSQENLYKGYQMISNLTSRKEMLAEMKEDFQGFFQGVKAILKAKQKNIL